MNQSKYAAHRKDLGLPGGHLNSVQNAIKSGRLDGALTPDRKAIADVELADRLWEQRTRANRRPRTGPTSTARSVPAEVRAASTTDGIPDLDESIARKEAANAALAERKLAHDRGEYLEIAKVRRAVEKEYATVRNRMLGIPSALASHLSRDEHRRVAPVVESLIRAALEQLADGDADV